MQVITLATHNPDDKREPIRFALDGCARPVQATVNCAPSLDDLMLHSFLVALPLPSRTSVSYSARKAAKMAGETIR